MANSTQADLIGRPLDRVDGALKVTGKATYAAEYATQGTAAYGFIVSASIGKGVLAVDVMPGVHPVCCS
jgi:xanthine dehydrogenase YagR molybdenum-binding subunit